MNPKPVCVWGLIQPPPTLTGKKIDGLLANYSQTGYAQRRMQYAPTHTGKKLDSSLFIESKTRYVLVHI